MAKNVQEYLDKIYENEKTPTKKFERIVEVKNCQFGYRWCPITKKCIPDTDNKGKGKRKGKGEGKGPIGKPTKEDLGSFGDVKKGEKPVEEGTAGEVAKTVATVAAPMVGGAVAGLPGAIAASSAMRLATQALEKRKAARLAQQQAIQGNEKSDEKYAQIARQRAVSQ